MTVYRLTHRTCYTKGILGYKGTLVKNNDAVFFLELEGTVICV